MPIAVQTPDYLETVKNAYLAEIASAAAGVNTYSTPTAVNTIKEVGVSEQKTEATIYASGTVLKKAAKHTMTNLAVSATALPASFLRKVLGRTPDTHGGFCFAKSGDVPKEFAFGYVFEYSNGDLVFHWHPRCTLATADKTVKTSDANALDPSNAYSIVALPYGPNLIIDVEYDQSEVIDTKNPLTEDTFFATVISTVDDIRIGTETTKT